MKAIVQNAYGSPNDLELEEVDRPVVKQDAVLVRVHEYACATENELAAKPANLSFEQAAAVPTAALTALQGLRDAGNVRSSTPER